jgi:hypothetical protein
MIVNDKEVVPFVFILNNYSLRLSICCRQDSQGQSNFLWRPVFSPKSAAAKRLRLESSGQAVRSLVSKRRSSTRF